MDRLVASYGGPQPQPEPEPVEPEPEPIAPVVQLPGVPTKPASDRAPGRDKRRTYLADPGSPDRFSMLPEHVLRHDRLSVGARLLYAELQRQVSTASPAMASLQLCTVTVGRLAANLRVHRDLVRLWLTELVDAQLIERRPEDNAKLGLRVRVPWTPPRRAR